MAEQIIYPQWRNQLGSTAFPFAATVPLTNGSQRVPHAAFVDGCLYPPGWVGRLYLSRVVLDAGTISFTIGDDAAPELATATMSLPLDNNSPEAGRQTIAFYDGLGRTAGILVFDSTAVAAFLSWGDGAYSFEPSMTEFAAAVCIPTPEVGVRGFLLDDGTLLTGKAWLVGGDGIILRHETALTRLPTGESASVNVVRVDVVGDPLFRRRLCADLDLFASPRFLRTLTIRTSEGDTLVTPDDLGNIVLVAGNEAAARTALRVTATGSGTTIEIAGTALV